MPLVVKRTVTPIKCTETAGHRDASPGKETAKTTRDGRPRQVRLPLTAGMRLTFRRSEAESWDRGKFTAGRVHANGREPATSGRVPGTGCTEGQKSDEGEGQARPWSRRPETPFPRSGSASFQPWLERGGISGRVLRGLQRPWPRSVAAELDRPAEQPPPRSQLLQPLKRNASCPVTTTGCSRITRRGCNVAS